MKTFVVLTSSFALLLLNIVHSASLQEGEMEMTEAEQLTRLNKLANPEIAGTNLMELEYPGEPQKQKRTAAIRDESFKWKNNTVPYKFEGLNMRLKNVMLEAITDWSNYTCINFYETTSNDPSSVLKIEPHRYICAALDIGHSTIDNIIFMSTRCSLGGKRTMLHELGHTLGLFHEHNRPDRDRYVEIIWENITFETSVFNKEPQSEVNSWNIPYDYKSITHFPKNFAGRFVIKTKDPAFQDVIGTLPELSFRDIKVINLLYNCGAHCNDAAIELNCPGEGFVGKDCQCWCPSNNAVYELCQDSMCPRSDMPEGWTGPRPTVCFNFNSLDRIIDSQNVTLVNAAFGMGLKFTTEQSMADLGDLDGVSCVKNPGSCYNGFTVSMVLKLDISSWFMTLLSTVQGYKDQGVSISFVSSRLVCRVDHNTSVYYTSAYRLKNRGYFRLTYVWSGTGAKMYINENSKTIFDEAFNVKKGSFVINNGTLQLGKLGPNAEFTIDDLQIFDVALTTSQIQQLPMPNNSKQKKDKKKLVINNMESDQA